MSAPDNSQTLRPAEVCKALLAALEASEGRRRKRKRDQRPDAVGLAIKRALLEAAVKADPSPDGFEAWLLGYASRFGAAESPGAVAAMARAVFEEWRLAHSLSEFRTWLERGAPSDDTHNATPAGRPPA